MTSLNKDLINCKRILFSDKKIIIIKKIYKYNNARTTVDSLNQYKHHTCSSLIIISFMEDHQLL